ISTMKWKQGIREMACKEDANDSGEKRFYKLEANVASLSKDVGNVSLSIGKLESITGLLVEKLGVTNETPEAHEEDAREYEEEQPRAIPTPPPFKAEIKIEIQPYDGDVNAENLDHWLQLE
ncbi:hypothetical protein KI387_044443, partial [Taxus chinensis]